FPLSRGASAAADHVRRGQSRVYVRLSGGQAERAKAARRYVQGVGLPDAGRTGLPHRVRTGSDAAAGRQGFSGRARRGRRSRIRAEIEANVNANVAAAVRALWQRVHDAVSAMATRLELYEPGDGESVKAKHPFRDTLVSNLRDIVELLP